MDPAARELDEASRFPLCRPDTLTALFRGSGLGDARCEPVEISTPFASFDDCGRPFLGGTGPAPSYVASLDADRRAILAAPSHTRPLAASPRFSPGGPDARKYGASEGYPVKAISRLPFFVGIFSHYDQLLEGRAVRRRASPSRLLRVADEPALRYEYEAESRSIDDYVARNPTTGLLIARGDTILVERYQYARTDLHRLTSLSMAKTVTAMLVGIAIGEHLVRSIDDPAGAYLPALAHTEYGRTSIRRATSSWLTRPCASEPMTPTRKPSRCGEAS